ncbi:MAG: NADH:flavin oxidoreductase [Firmicutes bacterium]|nr:NADH:flavin oxidoreductase [Bacillota bacterium]
MAGADSILWTPLKIGTLTVPNRLVRSATAEAMADGEGRVTEEHVRLYSRLARGGVGLIVTGGAYVSPEGRGYRGCLGADSDRLVPGLERLAGTVHREGGLVMLQLYHGGRQRKPEEGEAVAPSAIRDAGYGVVPRPLRPEEIRRIVEDFATAARRAVRAGFDGVQIAACNGHLVHQFLSPRTNRRSDEWGGSPSNRRRFLVEVLRAVRSAVGPDYPVTVKLAVADYLPGGLTPAEALDACRAAEDAGADAIEVTGGMYESGLFISRGSIPWDILRSEGATARQVPWAARIAQEALFRVLERLVGQTRNYYRPAARRVKRVVSVPVAVVGGIRTLGDMEDILAEGDADLIALSRPLVRDPGWPRRLAAGEATVSTCLSCNRCTVLAGLGRPLRCYAVPERRT